MDGNAPQQFHDSLSEVYEFAPEQREKKKKRPRRSASQNGRVISRAEAYRWHLHRSSPSWASSTWSHGGCPGPSLPEQHTKGE